MSSAIRASGAFIGLSYSGPPKRGKLPTMQSTKFPIRNGYLLPDFFVSTASLRARVCVSMATKGLSLRRFRLISGETRSSSVSEEWKGPSSAGESKTAAEGGARNREGKQRRLNTMYYSTVFASRALGSASPSSANQDRGDRCWDTESHSSRWILESVCKDLGVKELDKSVVIRSQ